MTAITLAENVAAGMIREARRSRTRGHGAMYASQDEVEYLGKLAQAAVEHAPHAVLEALAAEHLANGRARLDRYLDRS